MPDGDPSGGGNPPLWSLSLAPDDAQVSLSTGVDGFQSNVTLTLSAPVLLPPGTYWLVFYPQMDFGSCCQYARHVSDTTNGADAVVINPGGGFAVPATWTSIRDSSTVGFSEQDLAFRLEGEIAFVDLAITKSDSPDPVSAGQQVTYTLSVVNNGSADERDVTVTDTLPVAFEFVSAAPSQGNCSEAGGVVTCDLDRMAANDTATITVVCNVPFATASGNYTNTATVTGTEVDNDPSDNTATEITTVKQKLSSVPAVGASGAMALILILLGTGILVLRRT